MSFRKHPVVDCLRLAATRSSEHAWLLSMELQLNEPKEEIINACIEHIPESLRWCNEVSGSLALHCACSNITNVKMETFRALLLAAPETIGVANKYGLLPLHKAAIVSTNDTIDILEALVKMFPEALQLPQLDGQLPLHLALGSAKSPNMKTCKLFLQYNPSILSIADKNGQLPVHKLVCKRNVDIELLELLLETCPASACAKDLYGQLPLHWAMSREIPDMQVIYALADAYREGLHDVDDAGDKPFDKLLRKEDRNYTMEGTVLGLMEATRMVMQQQSAEGALHGSAADTKDVLSDIHGVGTTMGQISTLGMETLTVNSEGW